MSGKDTKIATDSPKNSQKVELARFHHWNKGKPVSAFDYEIAEHIKRNYFLFVCEFPYLYSQGVYIADRKGTKVKDIIKKYLYPQFIKSRIINQVYSLIVDSEELQKEFSSLNHHPKSWINFTDCMLDAATMQKIPHDPNYYSINQVPYAYAEIEQAAEGKKLEQFFAFIFSSPADRQMWLEYAGLCFTVDTSQQRFLTLCGLGGTGKSVLIHLLETAVGTANVSNVSMQDLGKR